MCSQLRDTPTRFNRAKFFPSEHKDALDEFVSLFHRYGYIYKPFNGGTWRSANEEWRLTDTEILKAVACKHQRYFIGSRAGKTTRFAVLDIDTKSRYHNRRALDSLIRALMGAGLNEPVLYRSSESEGWHLYLFFADKVPSLELHRTLSEFLRSSGYVIQKGTLEIFPNPGRDSLGCGLRLPLQPGWAWLDSNTLEVKYERERFTPAEALNRFMRDASEFANGAEQYAELKRHAAQLKAAEEQIQKSLDVAAVHSKRIAEHIADDAIRAIFQKIPTGMNSEVWWRGRDYFDRGLTGPGQRADAIFCIGHYLFYGDPERCLEPLGYGYENERRFAIESILAAKNHGHSRDLNRGRADAVVQIDRATKWLPAHKRSDELRRYKKTVPIAWVRHNGNLKAKSIERIKEATAHFVEQAKPFTVKELQERSGVKSLRTLYVHKALWHTIYEQLKTLPSDITHEYNAVVGAAGLASCTPAPFPNPDMLPGRLAARRVIETLAKKTQTDKQNGQKHIESIFDRYSDSWKSKVLAALPSDLRVCDVSELKTALPILVSLVAGAPDEESQIWLQEQVKTARARLDELRKSWAESAVQRLLLSG